MARMDKTPKGDQKRTRPQQDPIAGAALATFYGLDKPKRTGSRLPWRMGPQRPDPEPKPINPETLALLRTRRLRRR